MLIGILYGLYNAKARALAVLAAVGAVLTVLLVTRVQNMDDHQSLAVAPFYPGCFLSVRCSSAICRGRGRAAFWQQRRACCVR